MTTKKEDSILQEHITVENARLDRIEGKLDKLAEIMASLARAEEKIASLSEKDIMLQDHINKIENVVGTIQTMVMDNNKTVTAINRLFWVIITVVASAVTMQYI